eukprot:3089815-Pyramimonas_sp.AAC.2
MRWSPKRLEEAVWRARTFGHSGSRSAVHLRSLERLEEAEQPGGLADSRELDAERLHLDEE